MRVFAIGTVLALSALLGACGRDTVVCGDCGSPAVEAGWRLTPAGSEALLAAHLADGRDALGTGELDTLRLAGAPTEGALADMSAAMAEAGGTDSTVPVDDGFTNLQVAGVDEADAVKSDGAFLYVAEQDAGWLYPVLVDPLVTSGEPALMTGTAPEVPAPQVARYRLDAAGPVALASLALPGDTANLSGVKLLLVDGDHPKLVALGQSVDWSWDRWFTIEPYDISQQTKVWLFDLVDPETVPAPVSITLQGELVDSRRVGDIVYLVTRYTPPADGSDLLPSFTVDGESHALASAADCLLPPSAEVHGYPVLTLLVALDLSAPAGSRAACYAGEVYTMYMSPDAIYLAATRANPDFDWSAGLPEDPDAGTVFVSAAVTDSANTAAPVETLVHRFAIDGGTPHYTGSGLLPGGFTGWIGVGSAPQWRFHERDGHLFVVTSWWDSVSLQHHLYVLAPEPGGDLVVQATLPSAAHPEAIGKPGEDIQSLRYVGDRAYVVTFLQTDPLYVLDLADPLAPRVAGELALPGFSAYLHPIGTDWLLGVGRDAAGGIEANLFDVRDPANPLLQQNLPLCADCDAPLLTDYHAIAVQAGAGSTRVALPLQRWVWDDPSAVQPLEQVALLDVGITGGSLAQVGTQDADAGFVALGRALIAGDRVIEPQVGHVTVGDWPTVP